MTCHVSWLGSLCLAVCVTMLVFLRIQNRTGALNSYMVLDKWPERVAEVSPRPPRPPPCHRVVQLMGCWCVSSFPKAELEMPPTTPPTSHLARVSSIGSCGDQHGAIIKFRSPPRPTEWPTQLPTPLAAFAALHAVSSPRPSEEQTPPRSRASRCGVTVKRRAGVVQKRQRKGNAEHRGLVTTKRFR